MALLQSLIGFFKYLDLAYICLAVGNETSNVHVVGGNESKPLEVEAIVGIDKLGCARKNRDDSLYIIKGSVVGE